jgi:hypothetical protein
MDTSRKHCDRNVFLRRFSFQRLAESTELALYAQGCRDVASMPQVTDTPARMRANSAHTARNERRESEGLSSSFVQPFLRALGDANLEIQATSLIAR